MVDEIFFKMAKHKKMTPSQKSTMNDADARRTIHFYESNESSQSSLVSESRWSTVWLTDVRTDGLSECGSSPTYNVRYTVRLRRIPSRK
jgi:hypothetical protein